MANAGRSPSVIGALLCAAALAAQAGGAASCGEVVTLQTHGGTTTRYTLALPQAVSRDGGPGAGGASGLDACVGLTPHGFLDQEAEVAAGIARFIRGGKY